MKKIKKLLAMSIAAMLLMGMMTGCSSSAEPEPKEETGTNTEQGETPQEQKGSEEGGLSGKNISIMTPYLGSVTTNQMVEYIEKNLTEAGAEVSVINTDNDFSELASRIEDVVSAGTDGIVLVSADPGQLSNQLQEAFDAQIPVFGCDSGFIEGMQINATSDNYQMGELIVKYLFEGIFLSI